MPGALGDRSRYNPRVAAIRLLARLAARTDFAARVGPGETLLDVADRLGVPIAQACAGLGVCSSCGVRVLEGMEHLTPITAMERKDRTLDLEGGWRLACQALAVVPTPPPTEVETAVAEGPEVLLWHPAWGLPLPDAHDP